MDRGVAQLVRDRAAGRCEYCLTLQAIMRGVFPVDHIIARQHHGPTELENLALACNRCNLQKGPNIAGLDPETGLLTRLFHPRRDSWPEHFEWRGSLIVGRTDVGRTTVQLLDFNDELRVRLRDQLASHGG